MDETSSQSDVSMLNATREYLPVEYKTSPMYAGERQLKIEVCVFKSFPGSHAFFGGQLTHPITHEAEIYKSDAKEEFIFKQDIFRCLQYKIQLANAQNKEVVPMLCYWLSSKEIELNGCFELTPWNKNEMETFAQDLRAKLNRPTKSKPNNLTLEKVFTKLKDMLPKIDRDPEYKQVWDVLETYDKKTPIEDKQNFYNKLITGTSSNIEVLKGLFKKHPEWINRKKTGPAIVRAFEFGVSEKRKWFVMPHELLSEMRKTKMDCTSIEEEVSNLKTLSTWTLERAQKVEGAEKIKFVKTTIKRARHRAAYIPTFDGNYCIPTVDALTELLFDLISMKFFRNTSLLDFPMIYHSIIMEHEYLIHSGIELYFVGISEAKRVKEHLKCTPYPVHPSSMSKIIKQATEGLFEQIVDLYSTSELTHEKNCRNTKTPLMTPGKPTKKKNVFGRMVSFVNSLSFPRFSNKKAEGKILRIGSNIDNISLFALPNVVQFKVYMAFETFEYRFAFALLNKRLHHHLRREMYKTFGKFDRVIIHASQNGNGKIIVADKCRERIFINIRTLHHKDKIFQYQKFRFRCNNYVIA
ncbi:hypothetical protein CAEBREN_13669 [Caenorhabditis brenneri]|uniref:DUF7809 domain-containing protein n=1 Tax=Caenorhabditis brenneri TaxID=135651 RepID=G0NHU4_CAEBE|nr:hypothetical protein CAEBREN_13669 [Caenorhabditis brenneri]